MDGACVVFLSKTLFPEVLMAAIKLSWQVDVTALT